MEFGEFPSYKDYETASFRSNLLREKVVSFFHKKLAEIPQPVVVSEGVTCVTKSTVMEIVWYPVSQGLLGK